MKGHHRSQQQMSSTTFFSLLCSQPDLDLSSKTNPLPDPLSSSESLSLMQLQEPREDINIRPLSPPSCQQSLMLARPPFSFHHSHTRSPAMTMTVSVTAPFSDLKDHPYIPSSPPSASLLSAKWASDEHEALPRRLVVERPIWPPNNTTSPARVLQPPPSLVIQPMQSMTTATETKNSRLKLVVDTALANSHEVWPGAQEKPVIINTAVTPVKDDYSPSDSTGCDLSSFPWQLFPEPPPLMFTMQQARSEPDPCLPTIPEVALETQAREDSHRKSLSLQSDEDSNSSTRSFFQYPYQSQCRDNPYTYSSSDVATIPDMYSDESSSCACESSGGAEDDNDDEAATESMRSSFDVISYHEVQSRKSSSIDEPRTKRLSALLSSRHKSRPSQDSITVPDIPFDEHQLPTEEQLSLAASLHVLDENGTKVRFGDLWEKQRTVVCFIRHFWCPMCQDYMTSISRSVPHPSSLARHSPPIGFCIVSNGSPYMIQSYKRIFQTPFALYVDPTLAVYRALGMTLRTLDPGPEADKGAYIKHSPAGGVAMVLGNAMRARVPVWRGGGDIAQLGGEFVLGPAVVAKGEGRCIYAHRMTNARSHRPIVEVLRAAGVDVTLRGEVVADGHDSRTERGSFRGRRMGESMRMRARMESLGWLRGRKMGRREGQWGPGSNAAANSEVSSSDGEEYSDTCAEYADACGLEGCSFPEVALDLSTPIDSPPAELQGHEG